MLFAASMDYAEMLARGKEQLPEQIRHTERFEVMKVKGMVQGNKTILTNMVQIADQLQRPIEHLLKYLNKELAARGEIKQGYAVFNTKLPSQKINEKIDQYVESLVMCKECGRPDTKMVKNGPAWTINCQACGAKYTAKGI
jgi:translation initiation factor 2 subunit 2